MNVDEWVCAECGQPTNTLQARTLDPFRVGELVCPECHSKWFDAEVARCAECGRLADALYEALCYECRRRQLVAKVVHHSDRATFWARVSMAFAAVAVGAQVLKVVLG